MDILTNESTKDYSYISRYSNSHYYYNTADQKYMYGLTKQLDITTPYVLIDVQPWTTLDGLANKYYGRPDYFWIIADFNRIKDPFVQLYPTYSKIKVPGLGNIRYQDRQGL